MRFLAVGASSLVLLAAGCGTEEAGEPAIEDTTPAPTATVPEEAPAAVGLFFLRDGKVGLVRRPVEPGPATTSRQEAATLSMNELLKGLTAAERAAGLTTAIPAGTELESVEVEDRTAILELSRKLEPRALAQIVFSLVDGPTFNRVIVGRGGAPLDPKRLEKFAPAILVYSTAPGDEVSSPLDIYGSANTFEATFTAQVVDAQGQVLVEKVVTATSGSGESGTFETALSFRVARAGPGRLVVFELSAADGSRIHQVEIPLRLVRS